MLIDINIDGNIDRHENATPNSLLVLGYSRMSLSVTIAATGVFRILDAF
jgi:hypothetical protein